MTFTILTVCLKPISLLQIQGWGGGGGGGGLSRRSKTPSSIQNVDFLANNLYFPFILPVTNFSVVDTEGLY